MQRKEILVLVIDGQRFFGRFTPFEYPNHSESRLGMAMCYITIFIRTVEIK
jgi:hypothetical protein